MNGIPRPGEDAGRRGRDGFSMDNGKRKDRVMCNGLTVDLFPWYGDRRGLRPFEQTTANTYFEMRSKLRGAAQ